LSNEVVARRATFLQKSGPSFSLKLFGSHSSRATICAGEGAFSSVIACAPPARIKVIASNTSLATVIFIVLLLALIKNCGSFRSFTHPLLKLWTEDLAGACPRVRLSCSQCSYRVIGLLKIQKTLLGVSM